MSQNGKIEINEKFQEALDLIDAGRNVFITGRAGTGKSTLLEVYRSQTKKNIVVLAPTGVAALNVHGQTIHSFFHFKPDITLATIKKKSDNSADIYKKIDVIVIDEISMVRADLLDCVDKFMRLNGRDKKSPFGGTQMVFIGDLYQLPPVVAGEEAKLFQNHYESPYFFSSKALAGENGELFAMTLIELDKIYRQKDDRFIRLLNAVRNNSATPEDLEDFNNRFDSNFIPPDNDYYIYLTSTNSQASDINNEKLEKLQNKIYKNIAMVSGHFEARNMPTDVDLKFKVGAQIMLLNNDQLRRWVNGSIGHITRIEKHEHTELGYVVYARLLDGGEVDITKHTWDLFEYSFDYSTNSIKSNKTGSFTQYPFRLAWAVTIHKSQGKTFNKVIVDVGRGTFAHGQMYVALSRCTTLEGLVLKKKLDKRQIWMDWRVVDFITKYQYSLADKKCPVDKKNDIIKKAIKEKRDLEIVYLKSGDIKSKRVITPKKIGEFEYMNKNFWGVKAICRSRNEERVFRVDRILEIKEI